MLLRLAAKYTLLKLALKDDRGEGPVPYVIIVAIMAAAAAAIATAIWAVADNWVTDLEGVSGP